MLKNSPLRIAVVGCGQLARTQHLPNIVRSPRMVLHTCCDLSDASLEICRSEFQPLKTAHDFHDVVRDPDVDAICLATTETLRLPVIKAAAEADLPVYTEKPLAASIEEADAISKVVREAGTPFCVGHNRRCAPAMVEAHRIFRHHMEHPEPCPWRWDREGATRPVLAEDGTASMAVTINDDWHSWKGYTFDADTYGYGPMLWEMTHFVDLCNWFLAAKPECVVAQASSHLNLGVVIRYETGEVATISMCGNGSFGHPKEAYQVMGNGAVVMNHHMVEVTTAGIASAPATQTWPLLNDPFADEITAEGLEGWLAKRAAACRDAVAHSENERVLVAEPDKGHAHMLEAFVDEVHGRRSPVCEADDALTTTRVCFAAVRSAREQRFVRVDEIV